MKCDECKGEMKEKLVDYKYLGVDIGKFKAFECVSCGEQIFSGTEVEKIRKKAQKLGLWGLASKSTISKLGNSIAVVINKKIADHLKLKKGEQVLVYPENNHKIIIEV